MECLKVITPVDELTEWVSQIIVAVKKSGELRVCIDLRPLNTVLKRHGTCEADHDSNLDGFMCRCQQNGIKLKAEKLEYKCKEVPFLGTC